MLGRKLYGWLGYLDVMVFVFIKYKYYSGVFKVCMFVIVNYIWVVF